MDKSIQEFILGIINNGKDLTLATIRPDGYPQATTVSYANDGMTIYVAKYGRLQRVRSGRFLNAVSCNPTLS